MHQHKTAEHPEQNQETHLCVAKNCRHPEESPESDVHGRPRPEGSFPPIPAGHKISELSTFTSLCNGSRQQMTRMWFGKEGASDHCQMIVERVMGLGEDGTED